jgi:hypothetical protein
MGLSKIKLSNLRNPKTLLSLLLQLTIVLLSVAYPLLYPQQAHATTESFVMFDRISGTSKVAGWACLNSTATNQGNVTIVFPTGWTLDSTIGNWNTSVANLPKSPQGKTVAAWPGIGAHALSVTGLSVTFAGGNLPLVADTYCFHFDGGASSTMIVGDNQTGQLKTLGGNPYVDIYYYAVSIVAANGEQVTVSASVSATMQFAITPASINLGTLSTSTISTGNSVATITTNARNGWVTWIQDSKGSTTIGKLHSNNATADISAPAAYPTNSDLTAQAGYVVGAMASTGTVDGAYTTASPVANTGGSVTTTLNQLAYNTSIETVANTVTIYPRAKISALQAAATDYTDVLTVVAAGSF